MNILSFSESLAGISTPGTPAVPAPSAISFADALLAAQPEAPAEVPTAGCEIPQAADCVLETLRQQSTEAPAPPIFAARPGPLPALPIVSAAFEAVPQPVDTAIAAPEPEAPTRPAPRVQPEAAAPQPLSPAVTTAPELAELSPQETETPPAPVLPVNVPLPNVRHDRSQPSGEADPAQPEEIEVSEESEPQQAEQPIEPGPQSNRPRVGRNSGKAARAPKSVATAKAIPEAVLPTPAATSMTASSKPEPVLGEQPILSPEQAAAKRPQTQAPEPQTQAEPEPQAKRQPQPEAQRPAPQPVPGVARPVSETTVAVEPEAASPDTADQQAVTVVAQPQVSQRVAPRGKRSAPPAEIFAAEPQQGLPQAPVTPVAHLPVETGPAVAPTLQAWTASKAVEQVAPVPQPEQPPILANQPPFLPLDSAGLAVPNPAPPTQVATGNQPVLPPAQPQLEQPSTERPQPATRRAAVRTAQDAPRLASAAIASEVARQLPIQGPSQAPVPPSQTDPKAEPADPGRALTEPVVASAEQQSARWFGLPGLAGSEGATPERQQANPLAANFRELVVREVPGQVQAETQAAPPAQRPLLVELMQRIQAAETGQPLARAVKTVSEAPVKSGLEPLMARLSEKKTQAESESELDKEGEKPEGLPSPTHFTAQSPSDAPKVEESAAPVKVLDQVEHAQHLARLQGKALIDKPRELEVHLHSHKLGEVAARVKVESDGQWSAHVQLRDAEVERNVRQELTQIQETRGLEGFTTSLSQDSRDQRGAFQGFAFDQQQSRTPFGLAPKKSVQPLTSADASPIAKSSSVHGSPSGLNVRA